MLKRLLLALGLLLAPADAFAQSSKLSNLTAGGTIAATDLFYDVQSVGVGGVKITATQLSTFVLTPPVNVPLGTVTTNTLGVNITGTWNNAAQVFDAPLFENIVNTASATGSLLFDFQLGGTSLLTLNKAGQLNVPTGGGVAAGIQIGPAGIQGNIWVDTGVTNGLAIASGNSPATPILFGQANMFFGNTGVLGWKSGTAIASGGFGDINISRGAAGILEFVNGTLTSPTTLQIYNTTDAVQGVPTNFERLVLDWTTSANVATIGTQAGGTGTGRALNIVTAAGNINLNPAGTVGALIVSSVVVRVGLNILDFGGGPGPTLSEPGAIPVLQIGSLGAANSSGWLNWAGELRVAADVTNTTTTLATATGLSVALQAARTYSCDAELSWTDAAAGGLQLALVATGGLTATNIIYDGWIVDSGANGIKGNAQAAALGGVVASAATTGTTGHAVIQGTITVNVAGTLNVQFAQNTSNATATTIKRGSYMWCQDMP